MEYIEELKQRYSSSFDEIQRLVDNDVPEDLYMDYKSISTKDADRKFSENDGKILGKALSGFANVEGGILIWGIREEKPKGSSSKVPCFQKDILKTPEAAQKFKKFLEENTGRRAVPPPRGVVHLIVDNGEDADKYQAVVLTCIPKGNSTPLQSLTDQKFYLRSGESFIHAPYSVIAGMFGKRPTPEVGVKIQFGPWNENMPVDICNDPSWQIFGDDSQYFTGYIIVRNAGLVKVKDPYFSLNLSTIGGAAYLQYACLTPEKDEKTSVGQSLEWFPRNRKKENWRINPKLTGCGDVHIVAENPFESIVSGEYLVIPFGLKFFNSPFGLYGEGVTLKVIVGADGLIPQVCEIYFESEFFESFEKTRLEILNTEHDIMLRKMISSQGNEQTQAPQNLLRRLYSEQYELISSKNIDGSAVVSRYSEAGSYVKCPYHPEWQACKEEAV